jgi:hypothetical protein
VPAIDVGGRAADGLAHRQLQRESIRRGGVTVEGDALQRLDGFGTVLRHHDGGFELRQACGLAGEFAIDHRHEVRRIAQPNKPGGLLGTERRRHAFQDDTAALRVLVRLSATQLHECGAERMVRRLRRQEPRHRPPRFGR